MEGFSIGDSSEVGVKSEDAVFLGLLDVGLLILADSLLEEVGLAGERDHVHPLEGVLDVVELGDAHGEEEAVGHELDVLAHQARVHADQFDGEGVGHEFELNLNGFIDDLLDTLAGDLIVEVLVEEAGEVSVDALVSRDQLVGEGKAGHEATFFEPEDGTEGATEEYSFNGSEGNEALSIGVV